MTESTVTSLALRGSEEVADTGVESPVVSADELHRQFVIRLFERYRSHLLAYLTDLLRRPEDAEDIAQETYARLLRVEHLDRSKGRARAYLFRIATNLAYDRFRHRRARGQHDATEIAELASDDPTPEHIVALEQGLDIVKQVISKLTPRCRQVFLLRTARELSYEDIAERLGVSKRTVEREMHHALERCQKRLGISES